MGPLLVSVSNGQVVNLTNTPDVSEEGAAWSPDGEKLAYSVKPKQSPNYEIDVIEILTKKVTHLTSNTRATVSNIKCHLVERRQMDRLHSAELRGKRRQYFHGERKRRPRNQILRRMKVSEISSLLTLRPTARPS